MNVDPSTAQLLQAYIFHLERGDFEALLPLLQAAQENPTLERLLLHFHAEHDEPGVLPPERYDQLHMLLDQQREERTGEDPA